MQYQILFVFLFFTMGVVGGLGAYIAAKKIHIRNKQMQLLATSLGLVSSEAIKRKRFFLAKYMPGLLEVEGNYRGCAIRVFHHRYRKTQKMEEELKVSILLPNPYSISFQLSQKRWKDKLSFISRKNNKVLIDEYFNRCYVLKGSPNKFLKSLFRSDLIGILVKPICLKASKKGSIVLEGNNLIYSEKTILYNEKVRQRIVTIINTLCEIKKNLDTL